MIIIVTIIIATYILYIYRNQLYTVKMKVRNTLLSKKMKKYIKQIQKCNKSNLKV